MKFLSAVYYTANNQRQKEVNEWAVRKSEKTKSATGATRANTHGDQGEGLAPRLRMSEFETDSGVYVGSVA